MNKPEVIYSLFVFSLILGYLGIFIFSRIRRKTPQYVCQNNFRSFFPEHKKIAPENLLVVPEGSICNGVFADIKELAGIPQGAPVLIMDTSYLVSETKEEELEELINKDYYILLHNMVVKEIYGLCSREGLADIAQNVYKKIQELKKKYRDKIIESDFKILTPDVDCYNSIDSKTDGIVLTLYKLLKIKGWNVNIKTTDLTIKLLKLTIDLQRPVS